MGSRRSFSSTGMEICPSGTLPLSHTATSASDGVPFGSSVLFSRMSVAIENPFERNGCHDWGKEAFLERGCSSPSPNLPVWLAPTPSSLKAFHWWGGGAAVRFKNGSEQ